MDRDTIAPENAQAFIPEIWANRALELLERDFPIIRYVARDADLEPDTTFRRGDTINVAKVGAMTANEKAPHQPVTLQQPDDDTVSIDLNQHWEVSFEVEDVTKAQANPTMIDRYIGKAIEALSENMASQLVAVAEDFTNSDVAFNDSDPEATILAVRGVLGGQGAPRTNRHLFMNSGDIGKVMKLDKFRESGEADIALGTMGRAYGFQTHEEFTLEDEGSPAETYNIAMHRDAIVLATRALPQPRAGAVSSVVNANGVAIRVLYTYNGSYLAEQVTVDILYGFGALMPEWGVKITS